MKTSGFLVPCVIFCMVGLIYASVETNEAFQIETIQQANEDIVLVTDSKGKPVTEIDVNREGDYQLIKPTAVDDYVCLVLPSSTEESGETGCEYERLALPKDLEDEVDLAGCEDREVFLLQRMSCSSSVKLGDRGVPMQNRHHQGCVRIEVKCTCTEKEKYCIRHGWLFFAHHCKLWGTRCKRYGTVVIRVKC